MRCPSCSKFATYDLGSEPEIEVDVVSEHAIENQGQANEQTNTDKADAHVTGTVRIVLTAECCGDELKEANFDIEQDLEVTRAEGCECDLTLLDVEASGEISERSESITTKTKRDGTVVTKTIPYRYRKQFYGASLGITVSCQCGKTKEAVDWQDDVQASSMDELV